MKKNSLFPIVFKGKTGDGKKVIAVVYHNHTEYFTCDNDCKTDFIDEIKIIQNSGMKQVHYNDNQGKDLLL
jgi:hypothetical protein